MTELIERIESLSNPSVAGIDTALTYLPEDILSSVRTAEDAGKAITDFNYAILEKLAPVVPAVKVQVAYYEMLGLPGMKAFYDTLVFAKQKGFIVMSDVKRNDIGSTAACYAKAYLGGGEVCGKPFAAFPSDIMTVNGYLGVDGIAPFLAQCKEGKGIFVLVKTSNPSSGQLQDLRFEDGRTLYETMGALVEEWGLPTRDKYGFSAVGAVVGATHPAQAERLRAQMPHTVFLVPGYGAQGGTAADLTVCFDHAGRGAVVNSSRGILCAYRQDKYKGMRFDEAARAAAEDMREDIVSALKKVGKAK